MAPSIFALEKIVSNGETLPDAMTEIKVSGLVSDSRKVKKGDVFFALKGADFDGVAYLDQAINAGAVACVVNKKTTVSERLSPFCIFVDNVFEAMIYAASVFYKQLTEGVQLIGITGTNGKSSCVSYVSQLLNALHVKTMWIGTLGYGIGTDVIAETGLTTPDFLSLHHIIAQAKENECKVVVMEVSSHAIHQKRVQGFEFQTRVLLNITQDHLDYHLNIEEYEAV